MTDGPQKTPGHPAAVKDLKLKVTEALKDAARLRTIIGELENLPIVQQGLQTRIRDLTRLTFYLEMQLHRRRSQISQKLAVQVLTQDLAELAAREPPQTPSSA